MIELSYKVTSSRGLASVPIVNGQIIALNDAAGYYYDHNNQRFRAGGVKVVSSLPDILETVEADPTIYLLIPGDGETHAPGVYVIDHENEEWVAISSGAITSDAPSDGNAYLRKDGSWIEDPDVVWCSGQLSDASKINAKIASFYSLSNSAKKLHLKVIGTLLLSDDSRVIVDATQIGKNLVLDFSDCSIAQIPFPSTMDYPAIRISSTGLSVQPYQDAGSITIHDMDLSAVRCQASLISASQLVVLDECTFACKTCEGDDASLIRVTNSSSQGIVLRNCRITFSQTTDMIFFNCGIGDGPPIQIIGNTFLQLGSHEGPIYASYLGSNYDTYALVSGNTFKGANLTVFAYGANPGDEHSVDVSYNNLVIT